MSETLIIADLHLSAENHDALPALDALLKRAQKAHALYVLGDLFDYWVGDDQPLEPVVVAHLKRFAALDCPVYFQHGNRDFLLGEAFAARYGMERLPEYAEITHQGRRVGLCHGDLLCTDDVAYQAMRRQLRDPAFQADFLAKPLPVRQAIAEDLRGRSRAETSSKPEDITDVNAEAVSAFFATKGVDMLVHGHTHRPALHRRDDGRLRAVVGDWGLRGSVIVLDEATIRLEHFNDLVSEVVDEALLPEI